VLRRVCYCSLHFRLEEEDEEEDEEDHVGVDHVQVDAVVLRLLMSGIVGIDATLDQHLVLSKRFAQKVFNFHQENPLKSAANILTKLIYFLIF